MEGCELGSSSSVYSQWQALASMELNLRFLQNAENFFNFCTRPQFLRGGGLEYLHRSPATPRRGRRGNPIRGVITWPPCSWGL
jgi:hypothetical protein